MRYDETTASRLLALANKLTIEYAGRVSNIVEASPEHQSFENRLSEFEGIGPKTIEIFMGKPPQCCSEHPETVHLHDRRPCSRLPSQLRAARENHGNAQTDHPRLAGKRVNLR